jgi:UDP-N-acetylglucosamine 1-carboxyvinyltransferase
MGANILVGKNFLEVKLSLLSGCNLETAPFPGFPTDIQAQFLSLCMQIDGVSVITENIFENRFNHVPELNQLGGKITVKGQTAIVEGGKSLKAAVVKCTDLE